MKQTLVRDLHPGMYVRCGNSWQRLYAVHHYHNGDVVLEYCTRPTKYGDDPGMWKYDAALAAVETVTTKGKATP